MSLWRVLEVYGCNGNPVDGWEGCDQHDLGYLSIRDDWDDARTIKALADVGHLNRNAPAMFEGGELNMESDHGDGYEIGEIEQAWARVDREDDTDVPGYLDHDPAMTAAEVAEAEGEGAPPEAYELLGAYRPIMRLEPEYPDDDAVPFWRGKVKYGPGVSTSPDPYVRKYEQLEAVIELRINPEKLTRTKHRRLPPVGLPIGREEVFVVGVYVDGEYFGSRDFPNDFEDALGLAKSGSVVGGDELISEAKVALDAFMERGGKPAVAFLKVPAQEDAKFLFKEDPDLPRLVEHDGVTNGRDHWPDSIDIGAADITAIREDFRAWATRQVDSSDGVEAVDDYVQDIYKGSRPAGAPQYTKPQLDVLKLWYRNGVISGLAMFARDFADRHGDEMLGEDESERTGAVDEDEDEG